MSTKNIQKQWLWAGLVIVICVLLSAWIVFKDSSSKTDSHDEGEHGKQNPHMSMRQVKRSILKKLKH